jgi:hypothetical protein
MVSKISSTLRLDSQKEEIELINNDSKNSQLPTLEIQDDLKEDDVFLTSVPKQVYKKRLDFSYFHNSKVVEAAKFTGFDSDSQRLPNNVETVSLLKKSVSKIKKSGIYAKKIPNSWIKMFCNDSSTQIVSDSFWYIWHQHYSPNQELEKQLLQRISSVFVSFFVKCLLSSNSKDDFFKVLIGLVKC